MNDDLTPEEREAIAGLPRERMPHGLEGRVVETMRDRGILAPRRRTIQLTGGRVAGLVAACVALVVGSYSLGLHRGGGRELMVPAELKKQEMDISTPEPTRTAVQEEREPAALTPQAPATAVETREVPKEKAALSSPPAPRADEEAADGVAKRDVANENDRREETPYGRAPAAYMEAPTELKSSATRSMAMPQESTRAVPFILNGTPVFVAAPDSVRVETDAEGRVLLIYTSDGIIRIRLDDPARQK